MGRSADKLAPLPWFKAGHARGALATPCLALACIHSPLAAPAARSVWFKCPPSGAARCRPPPLAEAPADLILPAAPPPVAADAQEPLLQANEDRFVMFPIK